MLFKDVQLRDLGGCYPVDSEWATSGTMVGAPIWSSPEILMELPWNTVTDIWSFGTMVRHSRTLATGRTQANISTAHKPHLRRAFLPLQTQRTESRRRRVHTRSFSKAVQILRSLPSQSRGDRASRNGPNHIAGNGKQPEGETNAVLANY